MSRVGISNNIKQPDARCMSCKRWKSASKIGFFDFAESGHCSLPYCEKDARNKGKRCVRMNYIKAKFPNSTRSYVYRTEDSVKSGDTVVNANVAKLTVADETVDMKWVETYCADKVAVVKKYEESEE